MIAQFYLAIDNDDLVEGAENLPLDQIRMSHVLPDVRRANAEIVELYRPDGILCLKNRYHEFVEGHVRPAR